MGRQRLHLVLLGMFVVYAVGVPRLLHLMIGDCANCCGEQSCALHTPNPADQSTTPGHEKSTTDLTQSGAVNAESYGPADWTSSSASPHVCSRSCCNSQATSNGRAAAISIHANPRGAEPDHAAGSKTSPSNDQRVGRERTAPFPLPSHDNSPLPSDDERCGICDILAKSLVIIPALPDVSCVATLRHVASVSAPVAPHCRDHHRLSIPRAPPIA
ncbi:MAG: hypothetical protein EA377_10645 [Phycisphaerales bacterium]|nr:MAG: hypothetical protein EA377_10645 [Phycisphaerales bacterium]